MSGINTRLQRVEARRATKSASAVNKWHPWIKFENSEFAPTIFTAPDGRQLTEGETGPYAAERGGRALVVVKDYDWPVLDLTSDE